MKEIETPKGKGLVEKIYISDLNYLMIRVYFPQTQSWVTYNVGVFNGNLSDFSTIVKPNLPN